MPLAQNIQDRKELNQIAAVCMHGLSRQSMEGTSAIVGTKAELEKQILALSGFAAVKPVTPVDRQTCGSPITAADIKGPFRMWTNRWYNYQSVRTVFAKTWSFISHRDQFCTLGSNLGHQSKRHTQLVPSRVEIRRSPNSKK